MSATIEPDGLDEFRRGLKALDKALPDASDRSTLEAAELVADRARPQFPIMSGNARKSVGAEQRGRSADVVMGGSRAPYAPWLDFGGRVGRNGAVVRAGRGQDGRYVRPTFRRLEGAGEFGQVAERNLEDAARRAGFEVD